MSGELYAAYLLACIIVVLVPGPTVTLILANSIRHGGYVSVVHRVQRGLTFTANYTWAKSIDDASSM